MRKIELELTIPITWLTLKQWTYQLSGHTKLLLDIISPLAEHEELIKQKQSFDITAEHNSWANRFDQAKIASFAKKMLELNNPRLTVEVTLEHKYEDLSIILPTDDTQAFLRGVTKDVLATANIIDVKPAISDVYIFNRTGSQPLMTESLHSIILAPYALGQVDGRPVLIVDKTFKDVHELIQYYFDQLDIILGTGEFSILQHFYPPSFRLRPDNLTHNTQANIQLAIQALESVFPGSTCEL